MNTLENDLNRLADLMAAFKDGLENKDILTSSQWNELEDYVQFMKGFAF